MTAVDTFTIDLLEELVERGRFASTAESYLDRTFRRGGKETFYARTLAEKGREEAERVLAEWAQHRFIFASSIAPIVRGIIALARVTPESLVDITKNASPCTLRSTTGTASAAGSWPSTPRLPGAAACSRMGATFSALTGSSASRP